MNNERILSHKMSIKLNINELEDVSAAGTSVVTNQPTYGPSGADMDNDVAVDM
jgi:hypothetical protein